MHSCPASASATDSAAAGGGESEGAAAADEPTGAVEGFTNEITLCENHVFFAAPAMLSSSLHQIYVTCNLHFKELSGAALLFGGKGDFFDRRVCIGEVASQGYFVSLTAENQSDMTFCVRLAQP